MTTRSKYKAYQCMPRLHAIASPDSNMELLLDAVLLGFGTCRLIISKPDGSTYELLVEYERGSNHMHTVVETEQ